MPETRLPNSDFNRAFGEPRNKLRASPARYRMPLRIYMAKQPIAHPRSLMPPQGRSENRRLKISHTPCCNCARTRMVGRQDSPAALTSRAATGFFCNSKTS